MNMNNPYAASTVQQSSPEAKPARSPLWRYLPVPFALLYALVNWKAFGFLFELVSMGAVPPLPFLSLMIAVFSMAVGAALALLRWRFSSGFLLGAIVFVLLSMIYFSRWMYGDRLGAVYIMLTPPLTTLLGCVAMLWSSGWQWRKTG